MTTTFKKTLKMHAKIYAWWKAKYVSDINHQDVAEYVRNEGIISSRYSFMVSMSCAIAILGLLLSSPAVVIGAMLISPLMSPIMSLGFSLSVLDFKQMKKSLEALVCGIIVALTISWLIVMFSPITDATPEILTRTQPNLFDLLVAIFSGLAGGYAVIKRKGETIVGVAIATALMPPLAVVGFGLATSNMSIAKGAFMLFMTNLFAISLSVTLMTKFYGFGGEHSPKHTAWQLILIASIFGILSLPLGVALKDIGYQTYITKITQSSIKEYFGEKQSRISQFNVKFNHNEGVTIDAVVLTPQYKSKAQSEIKTVLNQKTGENINLSLDQVVVAQEIIKEANSKLVTENALVASSQTQSPRYSRIDEMTKALEQATFFPTEYIKVEIDSKVAYIQAKIAKGVTIATLRQFEGKLTERHPGWTIKVIPPFQSLPFVYYQVGSDKLLQTEQDKLSDILWALNQWNITNVTVVGFASSAGELERFDNTSLAYRRATDVLSKIKTNGIAANARAEYRSFRQLQDEKSYGNYSFQRVEIRLNQPAEIAQLESNATPKHNPVKVSANQTRKILSTQSKPENKDEAAALSAISLSDKLWYFNSPSNTNVILDQFIIRSEKFASE
jgi:uncharacterized hydrophobic protein (TIGR00271 family)